MKIRILGIDIKVHWTWWIFFFLFISDSIFALDFNRFVSDTLLAISLMFIIVMHELSHALVARSYGAIVHSIGLYFFGGAAWIQSNRQLEPEEEFWISFAGPLSNFVAFPLLFWIGRLTGLEFLFWVAIINLFIGIFNLIPAYPMDGGRIFRAGLEMCGVNRTRAVEITQYLAGLFGGLFIAVGMYFTAISIAIIGAMILGAVWFERRGNKI
jgi:Zn-dependent protease